MTSPAYTTAHCMHVCYTGVQHTLYTFVFLSVCFNCLSVGCGPPELEIREAMSAAEPFHCSDVNTVKIYTARRISFHTPLYNIRIKDSHIRNSTKRSCTIILYIVLLGMRNSKTFGDMQGGILTATGTLSKTKLLRS